ncbi:hypothetical protein [Nocardioides euryhalodurans]|uniref:Uncharacterized protein n=1 Tax=Nocardioides euryhalodurans TaxID=2518370 RepID=A0A4V1BE32_9ACTN|nr:hypothetical protein [Nocardioides euryhalodurans]QBR93212.1 hypothetical protein EXE57_13765 [Nocardioides euryhalodurans]
MTAIRACELAAWAVFVVGVLTMFVRGAFLRSPVQKYRTGWILALTMLLTGPVFAVVYTLSGLGVAETFFGDGGRRGPWFMAVTGAVLAALAPGALRRTSRGVEGRGSN